MCFAVNTTKHQSPMTYDILNNWFVELGIQKNIAEPASLTMITLGILILAIVATWIVRRAVLPIIIRIIHANRFHWDDALVEHRFFHKLSWFVPLSVVYICKDLLLQSDATFSLFLSRVLLAGVVIVTTLATNALLSSINNIYSRVFKKQNASIRGYTDAARIVVYVFCVIFLAAIITGQSPWGLLSLLGGLTAVTMLIFKDSLLGFVAHIQLTTTDMIRIGDWIEMPKYGADGDIIDRSQMA